jgi:hypothetical protein
LNPPTASTLRFRLLVLSWALAAGLAINGCDREDLTDGTTYPDLTEPPPPPPPPPRDMPVTISEVMVENTKTIEDPPGNFPPWIEIYNNSDEELDLAGLTMSDDISESSKWVVPNIPEAVVPPRGFLVVFADGSVPDPNPNDLHANFTLVKGQLSLVANEDKFFRFNARNLEADKSAGRYPEDLGRIQVLKEPTPGLANAEPEGGTPAEGNFIRGDASGDGRVNVVDMTLSLKMLFQSVALPPCRDRVDADDNGQLNVSDPIFTGASLFQDGPIFPPPYPAAGKDPTADSLPCPP